MSRKVQPFMALESVKITHVLRRMRGGSQSFLVRGEDDFFYVAKFSGNPQGNRTLINEWIGHYILGHLQITVPPLRTLHVDALTIGTEQLCFRIGVHTFPILGDIHLGSRVPADPATTAIFDFLPRTLFPKISNITEFVQMFVIDKWLGQTDTRQAIFLRDRHSPKDLAFKAFFIDNGMLFAGSQWTFFDSAYCGLYSDATIYAGTAMETICTKTIEEASGISGAALQAAVAGLPASWFSLGDTEALNGLIARVTKRQKLLPQMISRHLERLSSAHQ